MAVLLWTAEKLLLEVGKCLVGSGEFPRRFSGLTYWVNNFRLFCLGNVENCTPDTVYDSRRFQVDPRVFRYTAVRYFKSQKLHSIEKYSEARFGFEVAF